MHGLITCPGVGEKRESDALVWLYTTGLGWAVPFVLNPDNIIDCICSGRKGKF